MKFEYKYVYDIKQFSRVGTRSKFTPVEIVNRWLMKQETTISINGLQFTILLLILQKISYIIYYMIPGSSVGRAADC